MERSRASSSAWWTVAGSTFSLIFGNGPVMQFTFGVFLKPVAADLGMSRSTLSIALTVGLCLTGLCMPLSGRLVDRFGPRAVTIPAILLFGSGMMLPALATRPWHLIVAYGLIGIAAAGQTPLPYARIVASSFTRRRGIALGITMAGVGVGTILIPQCAAFLVEAYGWRVAYAALGGSVVLLALPVFVLLVRERGPAMPAAGAGDPIGNSVGEALTGPVFWMVASACFLSTMCAAGIIAHIVPLLTDRGVAPATAATAIGVAGLAMIAGRIGSGLLLDTFRATYVAAAFFLVQAAGVILLLAVPTTQAAFLATFLVGLGLGAEVDLIAYMIVAYFGLRSYGTIYGLLFGIFMLAGGIGPLLMGWAFAAAADYRRALLGFEAALWAAAFLMLALQWVRRSEAAAPRGSRVDADALGE